MMKNLEPKLTLGDKKQHKHDIVPLIVTEVIRSNNGDLSALAMLQVIQAKVNQSMQRFEFEFGENNGKRD